MDEGEGQGVIGEGGGGQEWLGGRGDVEEVEEGYAEEVEEREVEKGMLINGGQEGGGGWGEGGGDGGKGFVVVVEK